jgi:hypothetical protein
MKIEDVLINNWEAPAADWWKKVEDSPDEPLISATITMIVTHREYMELLDKARAEEGQVAA